MTDGILYIAAGEKFVEEAKISASSAKDVMPNVPITLVSDQEIDSELFDTTIPLKNPRYDGGDKIVHLLDSPYDRTLFVDTDIYFTDTIIEMFDLLDSFDFAVASNGQFYKSLENTEENIPEAFPEYNSGVMLYREHEPVCQFQNEWEQEFMCDAADGLKHNQPSFRRVLYKSDLRFAVLPQRYNCIFRRPAQVDGTVKILHGRLLDIESFGAEKSLRPEQVAKQINSRTDNRVFYQKGSSINIKPGLVDKLLNSLYYNGFMQTVVNLIEKYKPNY